VFSYLSTKTITIYEKSELKQANKEQNLENCLRRFCAGGALHQKALPR
jgi:hypothetical protein